MKKISSCFRIKDNIDEKHTSGFIYEFKYNRLRTWNSTYIGETARKKELRVLENGLTDKNSAHFPTRRGQKTRENAQQKIFNPSDKLSPMDAVEDIRIDVHKR